MASQPPCHATEENVIFMANSADVLSMIAMVFEAGTFTGDVIACKAHTHLVRTGH
jgi:Mg2+/citrate symporter